MIDGFAKHAALIERAVQANANRTAWSPFVESPSGKHHPPGAHAAGRAAFEALLGRPFELEVPGPVGRVGGEVSPLTGEALAVDYPRGDAAAIMDAARRAGAAWAEVAPAQRVGLCAELLSRWAGDVFANAYATMHTAGQGFLTAFAGSGANSLDRGLEALAMAHVAMAQVPATADYRRAFGRGPEAHLQKRYRLRPVGVAVVFACGTYPAWNAYPAILANLACGNPVVVKPHPATILPVAMAVRTGRDLLREAGFDANLLTLAVDTREDPVGEALLRHPAAAIVDFTGGQAFGAHLERAFAHLQVYTETAGCNAVVLESADDLDAVLRAVAHGLCLFSAQMCTSPQNLWVPAEGVRTSDGVVPFEQVVARLVAAVDAWVEDPAVAAGLCGAIHDPRTLDAIEGLAGPPVLRRSTPYAHPDFPNARTATPQILQLESDDRGLAQREHFGPMAFVIRAPDRDAALAGATADARDHGAIASYAYTTDAAFLDQTLDAFAAAGASVGVNLVRHLPINFTAAFSDFHVTGLNPAGTACLTDLAFVARRFRVVQSKVEVSEGPSPRS